MKKTGKCPKCGSTDVIANAKAVDRSHGGAQLEMTVATFGRPDALIFKDQHETTVSAWVCAACGFMEFYADNPGQLKVRKTNG